MDCSAFSAYGGCMRLLIALVLMFAFVADGAVAQVHKQVSLGQQAVSAYSVSISVASNPAPVKVCVRKLLTGIPEAAAPGSYCGGDFKLIRDISLAFAPHDRPGLVIKPERELRSRLPESPFRPPIS